MMRKVILAAGLLAVVVSAQQVSAVRTGHTGDDSLPVNAKYNDADTYLDLNSGKTFRFIYDELNEVYNRADLLGLDLWVNTRTQDTFWREEAIVVNNALLRDDAGKYRIDPAKIKRDGNTFKVKTSYGR